MTPKYEKIAALVALIVVGAALIIIIDPVPFVLKIPFTGLSRSVSIAWILRGFLIAISSVGADILARDNPTVRSWPLPSIRLGRKIVHVAPSFWILPALVTTGLLLFLRILPSGILIAFGLALLGCLLFVVMIAQYYAVDIRNKYFGLATFGLHSVTYLMAFLLYSAIYVNKLRSIYSATAVLVITAVIVFELLGGSEKNAPRITFYSLIAGIILGEVTWALNYWAASGLVGGAFLLLVLYVVAGFISHALTKALSRRVLAEYGIVYVLGIFLVLTSTFWLR